MCSTLLDLSSPRKVLHLTRLTIKAELGLMKKGMATATLYDFDDRFFCHRLSGDENNSSVSPPLSCLKGQCNRVSCPLGTLLTLCPPPSCRVFLGFCDSIAPPLCPPLVHCVSQCPAAVSLIDRHCPSFFLHSSFLSLPVPARCSSLAARLAQRVCASGRAAEKAR